MSTSAALDVIARLYGRRSVQFDHAVRFAARGRKSAIVGIAARSLSDLVLAA